MKVCDVTQFYSPVSGGVKRYLSEKQAFIEREGKHEHILIIPGEKNTVQQQGVGKIYTIQSPKIEDTAGYRFLWNTGALKQIIRKERPDLIESGDPYQVGWAVVEIAEELNLKKVAFYHSHFPESNLRIIERYTGKLFHEFAQDYAKTYIQRLYSRFDATLVPSPHLAAILDKWGVLNTNPVKLGVDVAQFFPDEKNETLRQIWGVSPNQIVLLNVGRLAPEKNVSVLLESFEKLTKKNPNRFHLVMVGDGPLRKRVMECAQLTNALTWQPYLKDYKALAAFYHATDLFVHPGIYETFGLVTIEAQACGVPVLGIKGSFMDRLAFGGSLEYWANENSSEALMRAILAMSEIDLKALGLQAVEKVRQDYSWNQVFKEIFHIYQTVYDSDRN